MGGVRIIYFLHHLRSFFWYHDYRLNNPSLSADAEHAIDTGHKIGWDFAHIIDFETNFWPRKVKESIWIKKTKPILNRDSGYLLSPIYAPVISRQQPESNSANDSLGLRKSTGVDES